MELFHEAVCLRMVRHGPVYLDAEQVGERRLEVRRELWSLVGGHVARDPKASNPVAGKRAGTGLPVIGGHWDGLWPSGEPVNNGEQVSIPLGRWKRSHKVDMDIIEQLWRDGKCLQGGLDVAVHLGALTVEVGLGQGSNLFG